MKKNLAVIALLVFCISAGAQEPVPMGKGSYASYAPLSVSQSAGHSGDQSQYMQYRELYIREQAGVPIPTNDWWTDLINADRGRSREEVTGHLWSYPQYVQGMKYGIDVHYPKFWIDNGTEVKAQSKLTVKGGEDFNATKPMAEAWSDWTVTFSEQSGSQQMLTTLMHGAPFTWIEMTGIEPVISAVPTLHSDADNHLNGIVLIRFTDENGQTLTSGSYTQFIVSIDATDNPGKGDLYGIYLPEGSKVTFRGEEAVVSFSGSRQFIVVALLHTTADLTAFAPYAYSKPTNTNVSWSYGNGKLSTRWRVTAQDLRTGSATTKVLQGQIPHHWRSRYASYSHSFLPQAYLTPRGKLKLVASNNIDISYSFSGMLPWYPAPADGDGSDGSYDANKMTQMLQRYADTGEFGADTYWGGKGLTQMALNMTFAREMGNEALFRLCHDKLKEALVNWLTYTPGEQNFFFARDNRYGGLIGYATSYDSETYNDHHFHYGYFTLAAALLAMVDDDFRVNYGDMIRLVARDYNNYKRDSWACFLRMMDPWAGHCYAGGMGDGAGNGQESTSESMQGWGGMYLLGVALGDTELRDAGIFGWVLESRATAEYWFDRHGETVSGDFHTTKSDDYNIDYSKFRHQNPDYVIPYSSNLTSHGVGWWTWFGGDPVFMQGIQWMPISPALDYLGEDKPFAAWDYERLMELKEHIGWTSYSGSAAWLGNSDWGNVVLSYLQWSDPDEAARIFDEGWNSGWPTMNTSSTNGITYFVTHSHRTYGDIQWDITANIPTARAYKKGTTTYHVAYNPTDDPLTVNFSDGTRFEVPARQMKVKERNYNSVTTIFTENEDTPDLREQLAMKNLALHKPCTASSYENEGCKPVGATDGDMESRWGSAHKDNEWLQVDLGENVSIYKVRIHWETAYPSEYRIELRSTENGSVTYSQTGNGKGNDWTELLMGDHTARYLRVVGVKRGTQYGTSLHEIEIYGRPASAYDTDLMGVQITCDQAVLKQGQPATLNIQGYDYCCQPKSVTATWNSNDGSFNGNVFTPTNYGNVTVNAEVTVPSNSSQTLTVSKTFAVEEALYLATLTITPNPIIVPVGDDGVIVTVTGKNQFGAAMDIDPDNLTFRVCTYVQTGTWTDRNSNVHAIYSMTDTNAGTFNLSTLNVQNVGDYALIVSCPTAADTAFITARKLPDINLAYLKSIKSNSVNGGNKPELAVDGDTKTRWESLHGVNDVHITVDLQAVYNINKVRIVWEPAYAKSYDLLTSVDGETWQNVKSVTLNSFPPEGIDLQTFSNTDARYVRLQGKTRATGYGYSLFELEVYGTAKVRDLTPEETTGIVEMRNEEREMRNGNEGMINEGMINDAWYTLDGRKIENRKLPRGIYIHNGKKVMIK